MKEELIERLEILLNKLSSLNNNLTSLMVRTFVNKTNLPLIGKLKELTEEEEKDSDIIDILTARCIILEKKIMICSDNDFEELFELKRKVCVLENSINRKLLFLGVYPSLLMVGIICFITALIIQEVNVPLFIKNTFFSGDSYIKIISFGLAGAFLYFIMFVSEKLEADNSNDPKLDKIIDVAIRFIIAILVPGILIALLFISLE